MGFKDCPKYLEAKAGVRRAAEENTSYRDALINMRKDERKDKKRSTAQDFSSGTISTSTAPGQTTLDDDAWPTINDNTNNTRQHRNMSRPSVARTVQSNRKYIAIQVDIDDDCQKLAEHDDSSQTRRRQQRVTDHVTDRVTDLVTNCVTNSVTDRMTHHHMTSPHQASHMTSTRQHHVTYPRRRQRRQVQQRAARQQTATTSCLNQPSSSFCAPFCNGSKHPVYTEQTCVEGSEAVLKSEQPRRQR